MSNITPIILVSLLFFVVGIGIIMFILVYQKKRLQYLGEKDQLKARYDKEILGSRLEIQEQTMKNISQEIHDNIGQILSVVKLQLNLMNCADPRLQEKIYDTTELVGKAIRDLRNLSKSLNSDTLADWGLLKAIEFEFDILKKTGVYTLSLRIEGEPFELPEQNELILFRMFQEIINNTIKHAGASCITVCVQYCADKFLLEAQDDGCGFEAINNNSSFGSGLRNLKNRCELMGAWYCVDSKPGHGTTVKIELPLLTPAEEQSEEMTLYLSPA